MFRLKLFGSASIESPDGPLTGRAVQRRRLALLALLARARQRGLTRDKLIGYLWPDSDPERARRLLSDSVYRINQALGGEGIVAVGDELRLDPARLPSDAWEFAEALEARDWRRAVVLHAAPFLDGFFLTGADELERWVDAQRETLARERARALEALAEAAEQAGEGAEAVRWWRLLAAQDPYSSRVALRLMRALDRSGDAPAALRHARVHALLLEGELELEPDAELLAFVEELRARPRAAEAPPRGDVAAAGAVPSGPAAPVRAPPPVAPPPVAPPPVEPEQAEGSRPEGNARESGSGEPSPAAAPASAGDRPRAGRSLVPRVALAAAVLAVVLVAVLGSQLLKRRAAPLLRLGRVSQVTNDPGLELDPALSPDGRLVAYSGAGGVLMVRQLGGAEPIRVVHDGDGKGRWPAWVPDGQQLVFIDGRGIESVPALGGPRRLLVAGTDLDRGVTTAPDGRFFAYVSHDSIYAAPLDGAAPRAVATGWEVHSPAWSPDGRWIAFVSGNVQYISTADLGNGATSSVWVVRASGGRPVRVTSNDFTNVSPAWTPGGALLFVSNRDGTRDVYQLSLAKSGSPAGAPVRLTTGLNALGIAMSLDGSHLAYASFRETLNVWTLPVPGSRSGGLSVSSARPVTTGDQIIENIGVSHDGRWLAFSSDLRGTVELYRLRLDPLSSEPQQLTTDTTPAYWPSWSPDDRRIAFHAFRGDRRQVFTMPVEGGGPAIPVTDGSRDERSPEWAPDGTRLMLLASWGTHPEIDIVSRLRDGRWSAPRPLRVVVGKDGVAPTGLSAWSPDGRWIACACGLGGIVVVPAGGGPARRLRSPYSTAGWAFPQWSEDGRTVFYISPDAPGRIGRIVAAPVSGAPPRVAVRFDDPTRPWHRYGFRVRNGRFYFTLGDRESDIWVAEVGTR